MPSLNSPHTVIKQDGGIGCSGDPKKSASLLVSYIKYNYRNVLIPVLPYTMIFTLNGLLWGTNVHPLNDLSCGTFMSSSIYPSTGSLKQNLIVTSGSSFECSALIY